MMAPPAAIGIDLGTTYSCVGYWKTDRVEIIANELGNRTTPSYVAFAANETLVGEAAFNQAGLNPIGTIFDAKRLIGRRYSNKTVQDDMKLWPFKVICGTDDKPMFSVTYNGEQKKYAAEEISSLVLTKMKQTAESFIGSEVKDAVITVPAYFGQSQRVATMEAGKLAGINVLRIINELTAAAIAYGLDSASSLGGKSRNVFIFDLGGGTLDVSLLTIQKDKIEVKAVDGDTHLGGEDFDNRVVSYFIKEFKRKHGKDITENPRAVRRLRTACERGKRLLSSTAETRIDVEFLLDGIDFSSVLTRSKFEELNADLFAKCIKTVENCLKVAKMEKKEVDDVVMVGGSTRIVKVQEMVQACFLNRKEIRKSINPDEAVAYGASVVAANLSGQGSKRIRDLVLVDVTPLSIGLSSAGRIMCVAIPRNSSIPTTKTLCFTTDKDNQTTASFEIYEGERSRCVDNKLLGKITLTGIPAAPRGISKFDVCFDLQAGGILNVTVKDRGTGQQKSIRIASWRSSGQEIKTMVKEAKMYKEEDEKVRDKYKARHDLFKYALGKRDAAHNLSSPDKKKEAEDAVAKVFQWMDSKNELAEVSEYQEHKKQLMNHKQLSTKFRFNFCFIILIAAIVFWVVLIGS